MLLSIALIIAYFLIAFVVSVGIQVFTEDSNLEWGGLFWPALLFLAVSALLMLALWYIFVGAPKAVAEWLKRGLNS